MSALRFEGIPVANDMADIHYLSLVDALEKVAELTPSQEAAGGLRLRTHGELIVTHATGEVQEKIVPVLYLGDTATRGQIGG